jgi:hypothetical protein
MQFILFYIVIDVVICIDNVNVVLVVLIIINI